MRLKNQAIILAGVGKGMGSTMARLFHQEGAAVTLVARKPDLIEPLAAQLGDGALAIVGDCAEPAVAQSVCEQTVAQFGRITTYCALAGGFYRHMNDLAVIEPAFFDMVLTNHIKSVFYGSRAAIPHLQQNGGGAILTVGAGYKTRRDANVAYATAKEGVLGLSKNLARELHAHNIRVNCISPGLVRLPVGDGKIAPPAQQLDRLGQPEDIAFAALYLVSAESAWLTGQNIVIDGGDEVYAYGERDKR